MAFPHLFSLSFLFFLLFSFYSQAADLTSDQAALIALRDAIAPRLTQWNSSSSSPCEWKGIRCSSNRVTRIHLPASGLGGQLPSGVLGNLTALEVLSLRYNSLSGTLPLDLSSCTQLVTLNLDSNRLSGAIPSVIFSLLQLTQLNLANNNFTGSFPAAFNNLTQLTTLYLERNQLSGEIPDLNNMTILNKFNVSYNNLNGSVPARLWNMSASSFLGMSQLCGGPLVPCAREPSPAPAPAPGLSPNAPSENPNGSGGTNSGNKSSKLSGGAIAGIAIGSVSGALVILVLLIFLCQRTKTQPTTAVAKPLGGEVPRQQREMAAMPKGSAAYPVRSSVSSVPTTGSSKKLVFLGNVPRVYDLEDLLRASAEVLGKGTFGTTYKAVLETGPVVAVKRLKDANLPEREYRDKVGELGSMQSAHLVPIEAYYYSKDEKLIVYEYVSMGSLSSLLHGNKGSSHMPLGFEARASIALSAARGIEYIHSTGPRASHGNIKSSNVLLSGSDRARISDQGLAQLVTTPTLPNRGSGYRAPEVTDVRKISQKADVYSFGVLLMELLTGKAPENTVVNDEGVDLPRWVQSVVRDEWKAEVFDLELVKQQYAEQEMVQLLQLAIDCTEQHPDRRPTMAEVARRIGEIFLSVSGGSQNDDEEEEFSI
ncbi:putative inactive receptor kinase At1g48480 [Carex rostrata]